MTSPAEMIAARKAICFVIQVCSLDVQVVFEVDSLITLAAMRNTGMTLQYLALLSMTSPCFLLELAHIKLNHVRKEANSAGPLTCSIWDW